RVLALGASMLDAPVSGSVTAAEDGTLAIMAGGPHEAFRIVEPLLRRLGRTVTHVGVNGQALLLKLAINISLAAQMLAFSEGVLLLRRADELGYARRDIAALYEVLARTPATPGMTTQPASADNPAADRGGGVG